MLPVAVYAGASLFGVRDVGRNGYNAIPVKQQRPPATAMHECPVQYETGSRSLPLVRCRFRFVLPLALASALLGGCATTQGVRQFVRSQHGAPIKTLVLEAPMTVDQGRLRAVLAPDLKAKSAAADASIASGRRHAQAWARSAMESALNGKTGFSVVAPEAGDEKLLDKIRSKKLADNLTQDEADRLLAATGADAMLRFGITDYGLTPKSWRDGYIAFEVTSTLAIAAVIAYSGSAAAHAAAGAYLVQETAEETAEAYAGFWAIDVVYRPVRLEVELVRLHPVATIWENADTGFSNGRWSRLSGKVSKAERNRQLDQATTSAANDVVADLSSAIVGY